MWKKGPMPVDTYGWGGVVPMGLKSQGFYFADFSGDKVRAIGMTNPATGEDDTVLQCHEVAMYNNSLGLPPHPDCKRLST